MNNTPSRNQWQRNKIAEKSFNNASQQLVRNNLVKNTTDTGTLNRRNANTLKKLGVSCQNLSSGTNTPERNFSAKSLNKNLSKSEHDLSARKVSTDSTTGMKATVSRFDIMTKFFNFNKNNRIEPIGPVTLKQSSTMDFNKRAERVGWMRNISNYFVKKKRRSSDR